jgi:hypothetical protein
VKMNETPMPDITILQRELADLDEAIHLHEGEVDHFSDFLEGKRTPRGLRELKEVYGGNTDEMFTFYERACYAALARIDALKERKAQIERLLEEMQAAEPETPKQKPVP